MDLTPLARATSKELLVDSQASDTSPGSLATAAVARNLSPDFKTADSLGVLQVVHDKLENIKGLAAFAFLV